MPVEQPPLTGPPAKDAALSGGDPASYAPPVLSAPLPLAQVNKTAETAKKPAEETQTKKSAETVQAKKPDVTPQVKNPAEKA